METKYILVEWPESQTFIGQEHCYPVIPVSEEEYLLDQAMFVPEETYNKIMSNYDH